MMMLLNCINSQSSDCLNQAIRPFYKKTLAKCKHTSSIFQQEFLQIFSLHCLVEAHALQYQYHFSWLVAFNDWWWRTWTSWSLFNNSTLPFTNEPPAQPHVTPLQEKRPHRPARWQVQCALLTYEALPRHGQVQRLSGDTWGRHEVWECSLACAVSCYCISNVMLWFSFEGEELTNDENNMTPWLYN